jgi:hypothetical protein
MIMVFVGFFVSSPEEHDKMPGNKGTLSSYNDGLN